VKIRTKLVLLLSAALVVTLVLSTLLRIRVTRTRYEDQLRETARTTVETVADDLGRRLTADKDDDDIKEELAKVKLRHPVLTDVSITLDTDEDTTSTFSLAPDTDEPKVARAPRPRSTRPQPLRREEQRRELLDHGESARRPGARAIEPLWWTPDKPEPTTWPTPSTMPPQPRFTRQFTEGSRGGLSVFEVRQPFDPDGPGPRHGELIISVSREPINELERVEFNYSLIITGGALVILMILTTLIVDRVVGRPVSELERAMQRVSGGVLDARVDVERKDEIGALGSGFNAMLARLAEADSEIRAFNARLADEVRLATTSLARKNAQLAQLNRLFIEARRELGDKERLAALGQLAAQLAHEIGTPLASVSGHLQLALVNRDVPAGLKERLEVAKHELGRVSKIVRDYLDSTRAIQPERAVVELERVIDEAIDLVRGDERRGQVAIHRQLSTAPRLLYTDPGLLRQVLVNLVTNAADAVLAAGSGGDVTIVASPDLQPSESGSRGPGRSPGLELSVIDTGTGIGAEDVARIFEPFYTTKGRGKGTGLGLAICRELTQAMGGRISVTSEPGRGSTFTLRFADIVPVEPQPPTREPREQLS
jgi:signal transduction histidine kinase